MHSLVSSLRVFAFVEGTSLLILLFIAMPLKYMHGMPQAVTYCGWMHGILFLGFVFFALHVGKRANWSESFVSQIVLSSMIPFGMFVMDRKLRR